MRVRFKVTLYTGGVPPISSSWCQAPWASRPEFFLFNSCDHSPYIMSSFTRGWVLLLQLLLSLASELILSPESRRAHDHILQFQFRISPNLVGQVPVFIFPGAGWPSYTTRHCVPFRSPFTTRRASMEKTRIRLKNLQCQSPMPWRVDSRWIE
jgi:hypothetical protein